MKILKLGDLHIGVKQDDPWVQNIQLQGIRQAIEISKKFNIKKWIQAGDWFDVRKAITHKTMEFNRLICEEIRNAGIHVDVIVGNHDATFKNKLTPNACDELLSQFSNFTVYNKATTVEYDGVAIDLVPWICDENKDEIMTFIANSKSLYNIGHYELNGFLFYKGLKSHGIEPDFLAKYKLVESGHFHTQSEGKNIRFIGTPWTLTAGDENDVRGFWIFDTETHENTFIANNTMWHRKITYPCSINPEMYRNLSVRVFITKVDDNLAKLETDLEAVAHEVKLVSRIDTDVALDIDTTATEEVKPLIDIIGDYIDALPDLTPEDVNEVKTMTTNLYLEATR